MTRRPYQNSPHLLVTESALPLLSTSRAQQLPWLLPPASPLPPSARCSLYPPSPPWGDRLVWQQLQLQRDANLNYGTVPGCYLAKAYMLALHALACALPARSEGDRDCAWQWPLSLRHGMVDGKRHLARWGMPSACAGTGAGRILAGSASDSAMSAPAASAALH